MPKNQDMTVRYRADGKIDTRFPYTYACDYLRSFPLVDGKLLSRSDASRIRLAFCTALGLDDKETAEKLADFFLANENESDSRFLARLLANQP